MDLEWKDRIDRMNNDFGFSWVIENQIGGMRLPQDPNRLHQMVSKYSIFFFFEFFRTLYDYFPRLN
jgi:hypothetical protein